MEIPGKQCLLRNVEKCEVRRHLLNQIKTCG